MQMFRLIACLGLAAAALAQTAGFTDPQLLFEEGRHRLKAGQPGMAKVSFETLIAVYPESPLVEQAKDAIRKIEEQEPKPPVVRSIRFEHFKKVKAATILERFKEREVALEVKGPFDARDLSDARRVVEELLAEEGLPKRNVLVAARETSPRTVEVTFRMVKE